MADHTLTAGRLTEDGHVARVSAEGFNIAADPADGFLLIEQTVVSEPLAFLIPRLMSQIAERPKPVVDGRYQHTALYQLGRVEVVALASHQRATVNPDHDRLEWLRRGGCEDVQEQAVFAGIGLGSG